MHEYYYDEATGEEFKVHVDNIGIFKNTYPDAKKTISYIANEKQIDYTNSASPDFYLQDRLNISINKDLFKEEDEDVVEVFRAQFGSAFNFKEVRLDPEVGFSGVRITTKDGNFETVVPTDLDQFDKYLFEDRQAQQALRVWRMHGEKDLNDPIWNKEAFKKDGSVGPLLSQRDKNIINNYIRGQKGLERAYDRAISFLTKHSDTEALNNINKREKEIRKVTETFNNFVKTDIDAIENKYLQQDEAGNYINTPDLFKPIEKTVQKTFSAPSMGIVAAGTGSYTTTTIQPYKEELELALAEIHGKDWRTKNLTTIDDNVKRVAREIIASQERRKIRENKIVEFLEELEDGDILPASLKSYEGENDLLKQMLTVGTKLFSREYATKVELFEQTRANLETNKEIVKFTKVTSQLQNPEYNFEIQEGEETVFLEDGREVPTKVIDDYNKSRITLKPKFNAFFRLQNELFESRDAALDADLQLDLLRRDYNDLERFFVTTGIGFQELFNNIGGATEDMDAYNRFMVTKRRLESKREEYAKPIAFDDAFKSWTNFGKFMATETSNQISIFTSLAVPYFGWGTLLTSSFGEQYSTMTTEEIENNIEYSVFEKALTSAGYAAPELIFELVTTVPLLRGARKALSGGFGQVVKEAYEKGALQITKSYVPSFARGSILGSAGEGATTVTQNIVTGKPWYEDVDHSLFSGLMFESSFAAVPLISGVAYSQLGDYKSQQEFRDNLKIQNKLKQDNKNLNLKISLLQKRGQDGRNKSIRDAKAQIEANNQKINDLASTNETILGNQKSSILGKWTGLGKTNKKGMSAGAFREYLAVVNQQEQLRIKAQDIVNNEGLSQQEKDRRLEDLYRNGDNTVYGYNVLQAAKDLIRNEKNSEFNLWAAQKKNKAAYDKLLERAKELADNPNAEGGKYKKLIEGLKRGSRDPENVARILYNIDKINANLKKGAGAPTKLDKDLVVYQTAEEAVAAMKEMGIDQSIIDDVKNAVVNGFDGPQNKSYMVVENMAKNDKLETKTHELSHRFFVNAVKGDPKAFKDMSDTIIAWAKENDRALYSRLIRGDQAPDEILAVFLEEAAAERVDMQKKNLAGVLGWITGDIFKKKFDVDMDFEGQSDMIQMLILLGKKLKAGKLTLKDQEAIIKKLRLEEGERRGKIISALQDAGLIPSGGLKLSSEGSQTTNQSELFKETNEALIEALQLYGIDNPERLLSEDIEVRKELAQEWAKLGDSRLWIGTLIGEKWRKFTEVNYLSKRDKAANYELFKDQILDVATIGIETGDNGIPFIVRSWNPAEEGGRTLTSHIFGLLETRLMGEGGIIDRKFPQFDKFILQLDTTKDDGGVDIEGDLGVEKVLAAQERIRRRKENLEEDRYRKKIGVDDKLAETIKDEIQEVLLSGDLGLVTDFEWTQRFSKASQAKLKKIIKAEMKDYDAFLKKIRTDFVKHAHTSDLVQMEKRETKKIFAKLKVVNASPAKIKLALLEGLIQPFEVKSLTAGNSVYQKLEVSEQDFVDFMKVRGRKDALVNNNINIMAMDAVFDVLLNRTTKVDGKDVRVLDEFIRQQQEKGLPHASNVLASIKERINRDQNIKFSKTVRNFDDFKVRVFYGKLNELGSKIDLVNVEDEDAINLIVEETYSEYFTKTEIKGLSKDLHKLIRRYATIDKNYANLKTKPFETLDQFLHNEIKASVLEETLQEFLDVPKKFSKYFDEVGRINNMRNATVDFGKKLIKTYNKEKALIMMVHASGMFSTSTKIGRGKFKVNNKGLVYEVKPQDIGRKKFGTQRYQVFDGVKDYNKNVLKKLFPELKLTDADNLTKIQTLKGVLSEDGKLKKINTSLFSQTSDKAMQDRDFEAREAEAKVSELFVRDIAQYYKDNKSLDKIDFGMLMMSMASNMQSPLKRAANLKYIFKDRSDKKYTGPLKYEHMIPTNYMVLKITDFYTNNKSKVNLDVLFKEYTVAVIPQVMDDVFTDMGLVNVMPRTFEAGQSSRVRYYNNFTFGHPDLYAIESIDPKDNGKVYGPVNIKYSRNISNANRLTKAINKSRIQKETRGITILDFDDTLATTNSLVRFTAPDGTTGTLNAEQYASTYQDLQDQGYTFDFSEFNKVVGGKIAPLFQKALKLQGKFGPENMFVLTARPPEAAKAIFDFLKANGLNIPLKNITGLGNSTAEAKALWVADKVADGYNDFYFADDALQNVQAVDNMLDQFDVKRKVQQARIKFSKENISDTFNKILEDVTGIEANKRFSAIKARKRGASKGKFRLFIPPSHEDFVGLLYNFMGKGELGNKHRDFLEETLIKPLNRAYRELNTAEQSIARDFKNLNKEYKDVSKKLKKKTPDGDFTYEDAIRVYLWDKHGYEIEGMSKTDQKELSDIVRQDERLLAYAENINIISKQENYIEPTESWDAGDLRTDLSDATGRIGRAQFFTEFFENADIIFSQENFNKIEAAYGSGVVDALKDMLYRIKTGRNRPMGSNKNTNMFMNWLNGSVGATMFFNIRSSVLQQMSMVNFINFADNNMFKAAAAFANQKQFWSDWAMLFNSDFMKQRRGGIMTDVNGAELAATVKDAKNPVQAMIKKLLQIGFLPTQIGDNIAIATGGATFYRNRVNTYLKQGLSKAEAESRAFIDFQVIAEATQQSARPDMVSQQQASPLGKVILAFQNVTSQFNRLGKKAFLDLKNRRITPGNTTQFQSDVSNISRIAYYFAIQNLVFYSLQTALFATMFSDDEDDERLLEKKEYMLNGAFDSVLRGSGVWGAAIATLKNMAIKRYEQQNLKKGERADPYAVLVEGLQISPPVGIKAKKIAQAEKTLIWDKKDIENMETFDIDNPIWSAYTAHVEGITNVPVNRLYRKTQNVRDALDSKHSDMQRVMLFSGWSRWNLDIPDKKIKKKKKKIKFTNPF